MLLISDHWLFSLYLEGKAGEVFRGPNAYITNPLKGLLLLSLSYGRHLNIASLCMLRPESNIPKNKALGLVHVQPHLGQV